MSCQGASTVRSAGLSEQRFQLGEHLLDRIEVCPLGPQPWVRTMLVLAQVSSMKTRSMIHE